MTPRPRGLSVARAAPEPRDTLRPETLVFRAALLAAAVHAADDAFIGQPGVGAGKHALAGVLAIAVAAAFALVFPRLRPGLRAVLALVAGVAALVNGGQHVLEIGERGVDNGDVTGALAAVAGLVLLVLAVAIPLRNRGTTWPARLAGLAGTGVVVLFVLMPLVGAIVQTHKFREAIPDPPGAAYRAVTFASSDGLELSGWYVRSRNRAAVVIVHGGGGDRTGGLAHARLLARHGYGVLVYDSRGRGDSEGSHNAYGWDWPKDVAGAMEFLKRQRDVDPERIGGLGLSTGADVLFAVGAARRDLKAIVADGATGWAPGDEPEGGLDPLTKAFFTPLFAATAVFDGRSPPRRLAELVAEVSPTPLLLIAAGKFQLEREFNLVYAKAAREPVELWDAHDVNHTAAIREKPTEYERRVIGLFDRVLGARLK